MSFVQWRRSIFSIISVMTLTVLGSWLANLPQDAGPAVEGRVASLSFAPFRQDMSPLEERFPSAAQIDEDLRLLADRTASVRTYSSLGGMQVVPELARRHGLSVTQGAWLGYPGAGNEREIQALIESANAHPDVVRRVIVGNEVLLRGEMTPEQLIAYIRRVRQAVAQPVSYADVWSIYMKYPQLIDEVEFITIHILPYWEDEPIAVDDAPAHIGRIYRQVEGEAAAMAPGKPILIGETGWPAAGRQRGHAVPGVVNQARFIRTLVPAARQSGFDYNIVEAFDQPWKRALEGVVGAHWGLFDAERRPVFPLAGPVVENREWLSQALAAVALWLLAALGWHRQTAALPWQRLLLWQWLGQLLALLLVQQAVAADLDGWRSLPAWALVIASTALALLIMERARRLLATSPAPPQIGRWLVFGYLAFTALAIHDTAMLAWNGRYLLFPVHQFAVPVAGIIGLMLCLGLRRGRRSRHSLAFGELTGGALPNWSSMAYLLPLSMVPALVAGEMHAFLVGRDFVSAHPDLGERLWLAGLYTLSNGQLLSWLVCLVILALPFQPCLSTGCRQK